MNIKHQDDKHKGEFFILAEDSIRIAKMTYFWNSTNVFSIDHTWVDNSLRGQGVAKQLFDAAITFAREKNAKIIPICSYAIVMFQRDKTLTDILAHIS